MAPWLTLFTWLDEEIFIDMAKYRETRYKQPKEGFALEWMRRYQIMATLFGDYTIVDDDILLDWNALNWLMMIGWSLVQSFLATLFEAFFLVWGFLAAQMLTGVVLYETMVLGISFDDIVF